MMTARAQHTAASNALRNRNLRNAEVAMLTAWSVNRTEQHQRPDYSRLRDLFYCFA